jgi:hypothetical protein
MDVKLHTFSTSALDRGEWSVPRPAALSPGKDRQYPLNRRLGGPQSLSGSGGEGKKKSLHFSCPALNPGRPALSLFTVLNEPPRLLKPTRKEILFSKQQNMDRTEMVAVFE